MGLEASGRAGGSGDGWRKRIGGGEDDGKRS